MQINFSMVTMQQLHCIFILPIDLLIMHGSMRLLSGAQFVEAAVPFDNGKHGFAGQKCPILRQSSCKYKCYFL